MNRPTFASATLFIPIGAIALTGLFAITVTILLSAGATPQSSGIFALTILMGTGETMLHFIDRTIHRILHTPTHHPSVTNTPNTT